MSPTTRIEAKNSSVSNVRNSGDVEVVATAGSVVKDVSVGSHRKGYTTLILIVTLVTAAALLYLVL